MRLKIELVGPGPADPPTRAYGATTRAYGATARTKTSVGTLEGLAGSKT